MDGDSGLMDDFFGAVQSFIWSKILTLKPTCFINSRYLWLGQNLTYIWFGNEVIVIWKKILEIKKACLKSMQFFCSL